MNTFTIGQRVDTPMGLGTVKGFEMYLQGGWVVDVFDADPQTGGSRVIVRLDDPARWAVHDTRGDPYFFRSQVRAWMTEEQARWASQHDWFHSSEEYEPGKLQVWAREGGKLHPWPFRSYQELRAWAGY